MKTFFKHLTIQLFILLSIGVGYAAWNTLVTDGETLTATKWNGLVGEVNTLKDNLSGFSFSEGNISIGGSVDPLAKLSIEGGKLSVSSSSNFYTSQFKNPTGSAIIVIDRNGPVNASSRIRMSNTDFLNTDVEMGYNGDISSFVLEMGGNITNPDDGNPHIYVSSSGQVGINTTPTARLSVSGIVNKSGGGSWAVLSDARSKEDVEIYTKGIPEILQLRPVSFRYKENMGWGTDPVTGLIAQEAEQIVPTMVSDIGEINGIQNFKQVDPNELTYMLINAVKYLYKDNNMMKEEINRLKNN